MESSMMRSLAALKSARLKTGQKKTLKVIAKSTTDSSTCSPSVTPTHRGGSGEKNAWSVGSTPHYTFMLSRAALALRFETRSATESDLVEFKPLQRQYNYLTPSPQPKKYYYLVTVKATRSLLISALWRKQTYTAPAGNQTPIRGPSRT
jgi:hypothetical protein